LLRQRNRNDGSDVHRQIRSARHEVLQLHQTAYTDCSASYPYLSSQPLLHCLLSVHAVLLRSFLSPFRACIALSLPLSLPTFLLSFFSFFLSLFFLFSFSF